MPYSTTTCDRCGRSGAVEVFWDDNVFRSAQEFIDDAYGHESVPFLCGCQDEEFPDDEDEDDRFIGSGGEEPDEDVQPRPVLADGSPIMIPYLPGRPYRLMSFEQEFTGNLGEMAFRLAEVVDCPRLVENYSDLGGRHFCIVKSDSSCGGEVLYSKLDLTDPNVCGYFVQANDAVRGAKREGAVGMTTACGFHAHIGLNADPSRGVSAFDMDGVLRLYRLHCYLEDVCFRLGASHWERHRTEGRGYASIVPKNLAGKLQIGQQLLSDRYGLNLSPYLYRVRNCRCGAVQFEEIDRCTCLMEKPTVEFRWPNATCNLRKIHAYAALMQAMVAWAGDEGNHDVALGLPTNEYLSPANATAAADRLVVPTLLWMAESLVLTGEEWLSILYCADHAPRINLSARERTALIRAGTGHAARTMLVPIGVS